MGIKQTVYSRLTTASAGSLIGDRCYPDMLPENTAFPAIRYMAGVSYDDRSYREYGNPAERAKRRVQIDCYAETSDGASELADAVDDDFDGWTKGTAVGYSRVMNRIDFGWQGDIEVYLETVEVTLDHKK